MLHLIFVLWITYASASSAGVINQDEASYQPSQTTISKVAQDGMIYTYRCQGDRCDLVTTHPDPTYLPPSNNKVYR